MSPARDTRATVRSAEEINAEIRALWPHGTARLSEDQRLAYEALVMEWALAARGGVVKAA